MQQEVNEEKSAKRRKLLLFVPIFLIAFGGLFYLALSTGSSKKEKENPSAGKSALNTELPEASLQPSEKNKLEIYMQAEKDSAKRMEAERSDPYSSRYNGMNPLPDDYKTPVLPKQTEKGASNRKSYADPNEKKVNDRLEKLYAALSDNETSIGNTAPSSHGAVENPPSPETVQLEKMLQAMHTSTDTGVVDPEMQQIDNMLEKLLDIQYPERMREKINSNSNAVIATRPVLQASAGPVYYNTAGTVQAVGFYGLQSELPEDTTHQETLLAVIHETQTLQNGSTVKLRLLQDMYVGSKRIPAGNFLFGTCSISDERLIIQLFNAIYRNEILPVQLSVFDTDGLEGVHVPGAITRSAAKDGSSQFLQSVGTVSTVDPSLAAQATAAGIQTASGLLSRKVKNIQVTVKSGHQVLLRNKQL